jgi:hypothetical protein
MDNIKNPDDIFYYQSTKSHIDTTEIFSISMENNKLRIKNNNINCLYNNLTEDVFDKIYNEYNKYLNLNLEPLKINDRIYCLDDNEIEELVEKIITSLIYYYVINNLEIEIKRDDFIHPSTAEKVLYMINNKYGEDTLEGLKLGAKILRKSLSEYEKTVKFYGNYYKWK